MLEKHYGYGLCVRCHGPLRRGYSLNPSELVLCCHGCQMIYYLNSWAEDCAPEPAREKNDAAATPQVTCRIGGG